MTHHESEPNIQESTHERDYLMETGPSPLLPKYMLDLFIRPQKFFSGKLALGKTPYFLFITWCCGIANIIDRIERNILRAELGRPRPGWEELYRQISEDWLRFWIWVLVSGAVNGLIFWWIGGCWFNLRLKWSKGDVPVYRLGRLVFVYSSFVRLAPMLLLVLAYTVAYPNYAQASSSGNPFAYVLLLFPLWSVIVSYIGARTVFNVRGNRANFWFLILPGLHYIVGLVLLLVVINM